MSETMEMTGGEALARMLAAHGIGPMFGMGGFQLLPFYDAARRLGIDHNLVNDERCGVFAADAWAKVTGRVGVCDATLGPGATNLLTGMVEALNAGTPLVLIAGDSHRDHSWKNMTQESRQMEILRPAAKELIRIEAIQRIPELVRRAFAVATRGRPGPVVLDVPEDIAHGRHAFDSADLTADPSCRAAPVAAVAAERRIASRGGRAPARRKATARPRRRRGPPERRRASADRVRPSALAPRRPHHDRQGRDRVHPSALGGIVRPLRPHRERADRAAPTACSSRGASSARSRPAAFPSSPTACPLIHLDIVAEEIGRTARPSVALWADCREGLRDLADALSDDAERVRGERSDYAAEVKERMAKWRAEVDHRLTSNESPINMARMIHELNRLLDRERAARRRRRLCRALVRPALRHEDRPGRGFVPDRGFASIGYGCPAPWARSSPRPGRQVVGITGDGGFNMVIGELETARRMGLGFTLLIVNNAASGYVKALQHLMYGQGGYQSSDLVEMNYANIAAAMGCHGIRVEDPDRLAGAIESGLDTHHVPTIIDVVVTREPGQMLPGVDSRTVTVKEGDRVA